MESLDNLSPEEILELQRKNCIFCKIINKEIPSNLIYEDDKVYVILDINPANEGHCLILPKEHYQILPQIPDDIIGYLFATAKKTSRALLKALALKGTTIFVANGAVAGQKAPHFMIHVIPRKKGDLLFQIPKNKADEPMLNEIKIKLTERLASLTGRRMIEEKPKEEPKEPPKEPKEEVKEPVKEEKKAEEKKPAKKKSKKSTKKDKSPDLDKISGLFT